MRQRIDRTTGYSGNVNAHDRVQPWEKRWLGAIICLSVLVLLCSIRYPVYRTDNVYFVVGAYSLASGQGYADISRPGAPLLTKYPPAQALTMAAALPFAGYGLQWVRLTSIVLQPVLIVLAFLLVRPRGSPCLALASAALLALHPVCTWGHMILGNFGLTASAFIAVLWLHEGYKGKHLGLWLGAVLVLAFYCHRAAMVLAAISVVWLALRGLRREAVIAGLVFAAGIFPWCWRSYASTGFWLSREYQGEIVYRTRHCADANTCDRNNEIRTGPFAVEAAKYAWANVPLSIQALGGLVPWADTPLPRKLGRFGDPAKWISWWLITWLVFVGWWQDIRGRRWTEIPFSAVYLPWHLVMTALVIPGIQYLPWLLGLLYAYAGKGLVLHLPGNAPKVRTAVVVGVVGLTIFLLLGRHKMYFRYLGPPNRDARQARWQWVAKHTPAGTTVYWVGISDYAVPQWRWFDTGRLARGIPRPELGLLKRATVNYVALKSGQAFERALINAGWRVVYREPATVRDGVTLWKRPSRVV